MVGNHEILDHVAMRISITVPEVLIMSDICLTGLCKLQRVAVESTFREEEKNGIGSIRCRNSLGYMALLGLRGEG